MRFVLSAISALSLSTLLLIGSSIPSVVDAEDTMDSCSGFAAGHGTCLSDMAQDFHDFISDQVSEVVPDPGPFMSALHGVIVPTIFNVAMGLWKRNTLGIPDGCLGDFQGDELSSHWLMDELGCGELPVFGDKNYGVVTAKFPITTAMQLMLMPMGLWGTPRLSAVVPDFCIAGRLPGLDEDCRTMTFGMTINDETLVTVGEVMPASEYGDPIIAFLTILMDTGLDKITFAASLRDGGLQVPTLYYYDDTFFEEMFATHLYFSFSGNLELPFLPGAINNMFAIHGKYYRSFNLGAIVDGIEAGLTEMFNQNVRNLEPKELMSYFLDHFAMLPEVITTESDISLDLSGFTFGLLDGFDISNAEVKALRSPGGFNDMPPGLFFSVARGAETIEKIAKALCSSVEGALMFVADRQCDSIPNAWKQADLGVAIHAAKMAFKIDWGDFLFECKLKNLASRYPRMACDFNGVYFAVERREDGFSVAEVLGDVFDSISDQVDDILDDATDLFGRRSQMDSIRDVVSSEDDTEDTDEQRRKRPWFFDLF